MHRSNRTALIAGATGLVGSACLRELLQTSEYERVLALVRRPLAVKSAKLGEIRADTDHIGELPAMQGGAVFCAIGTTIRKAGSQAAFRQVDYKYPLKIAQAALQAGASDLVLVSSVGADAGSSTFYLRVKGELETAIGMLGFRSFHILRPSVLMGDRQENRPAERMGIAVARTFQFLLAGGLSKYRPIAADDVGRAMVRCANTSATGQNIYHWREIMDLLHSE